MRLFTSKGVPLLAAWDVSQEMLYILPAWESAIGDHFEKSIVGGPVAKELEEEFTQAGHMGYIHGNTGRILSLHPRYGEEAFNRYYGEKRAVMAAFDGIRTLYIGPVGTNVYDAATSSGIYREEIAKDFHSRGLLGTINGNILTLPLPWETEAEKEGIKPVVDVAVDMCTDKLLALCDGDRLWMGKEGAIVQSDPYPYDEAGRYYDGFVKGKTAKLLLESGLFDIGVIVDGRLRRA